ncbi:MAG: glutamate-semialdehyde -aminomutase, partial [Gaiellales bacterium]|nr:glutamate-semialdehyde -aminomutase [Gaiellales bacterium]
MSATTHAHIDRGRLAELLIRERERFADEHPRSRELFAETSKTLLGGVPMSWMTMWAGGFPLFFEQAQGARVVDVDGRSYIDL